MSLSPELLSLKNNERNYHSNDSVRLALSQKIISMIVGPTAVGKSAIINEVLNFKNDWNIAGTITTRGRRVEDPSNYLTSAEGMTGEVLIKQIQSSELTNYSVHPGGDFYAYSLDSFSAQYNLAPMITPNIEVMKKAGFQRSETIFIYAQPQDYELFIKDRLSDAKIAGRLEEAIISLQYGIENADSLHIIENTMGSDGLRKSAQKVIEITMGEADINESKDYNVTMMRESLDFINKTKKAMQL